MLTTISEKALIARINRRLKHQEEKLFKTRAIYSMGQGPYFDGNLGEFYILDTRQNLLVAAHCNLEGLGREMGVLTDHETI